MAEKRLLLAIKQNKTKIMKWGIIACRITQEGLFLGTMDILTSLLVLLLSLYCIS